MNPATTFMTNESILKLPGTDIKEETSTNVYKNGECSKILSSAKDYKQENGTIANGVFQEVPHIQISYQQRKSSLDEEELKKFLLEMEESFDNLPTAIDTISVDDLRPPDFYRSVSRTSLNEEVEDPDHLVINGIALDCFDAECQDSPQVTMQISLHHPQYIPGDDDDLTCFTYDQNEATVNLKPDDDASFLVHGEYDQKKVTHTSSLDNKSQENNISSSGMKSLSPYEYKYETVPTFTPESESSCLLNVNKGNKDVSQQSPSNKMSWDDKSTDEITSLVVENHQEVESGQPDQAPAIVQTLGGEVYERSGNVESEKSFSENEDVVHEERTSAKLRERMLFTGMSSMSITNTSPSPLFPPSNGTNLPLPPQAPPTPVIDLPQHSLLELMTDDKDDKRRSMSFNLAAKGWGTYNKFYTPVTFAT